MATRRIVILERVAEPSDYNFKYILRANNLSKLKDFFKASTSLLKDASPDELAEVQAGLVVEIQDIANYKEGTDLLTIEQDLERKLISFQDQINSRNPFKLFGSSFDGTSWTIGGIA